MSLNWLTYYAFLQAFLMPVIFLFILLLPAALVAEPLFRGVSWGMAPDQVEITELNQAQSVPGPKDTVIYLNYQMKFFEEEYQLQYGFENQQLKQINMVWLASGREFRRRERPLRLAEFIFKQWQTKLEDQFGKGNRIDQKNFKRVEWKTSEEFIRLSLINIGQLPLLNVRLESIQPGINQPEERAEEDQ